MGNRAGAGGNWRKGHAEMTMILWIFAAFLFVLNCGQFFYILSTLKPAGPIIPLNSPCPACGNLGCKLAYDPKEKKVGRTCITCGCTLTQPVVAPDLFK